MRQETNVVLTQYLSFLARLALDDAGYLSNAVNNAGQQFGQVGLVGMLVELWMEKVNLARRAAFHCRLHVST